MLHLRLLEASGAARAEMETELFSRQFLLARPLLWAVEASRAGQPPVLLIDEIDRAEEEFEAFLLELLSDFQCCCSGACAKVWGWMLTPNG